MEKAAGSAACRRPATAAGLRSGREAGGTGVARPAIPSNGNVAARQTALPEKLQFLNRRYNELDVSLDPVTRSLWCHMRPDGPPSFTPTMVRELTVLHRAIEGLMRSQAPGEEPEIRYYVQGSRIPGIYNMGGDLGFITRAVRAGEREALKAYAFRCVDAVYNIAVGFESSIVTVGLLEGDALGGGFEGALCCNVLIAERSVQLGFPEILFHAFPGMGGYSLLARRLDVARAERMIFSGRVYSAEEMHEMGLIDQVVDDGRGEDAVREYVKAGVRDHAVRQAIYRVRQRVNPLSLDELRAVTELWVDTILNLSPADLRRMEILLAAQQRRLSRAGSESRESSPSRVE